MPQPLARTPRAIGFSGLRIPLDTAFSLFAPPPQHGFKPGGFEPCGLEPCPLDDARAKLGDLVPWMQVPRARWRNCQWQANGGQGHHEGKDPWGTICYTKCKVCQPGPVWEEDPMGLNEPHPDEELEW